jgi:hypothetical protein
MESTQAQLDSLRSASLAGFERTPGFVYPHYEGQSILNIPGSIAGWLGATPFGAPPLLDSIRAQLAPNWQRVIFLLVDALAFHRLQAWLAEPRFAALASLRQNGVLAPLTSISPSTTCAALTSFWTGVPAAQHGTVGYELWLREYGLVANMILHAPFSFERQTGSLQFAGFDAANALGLPTLGSHLAAAGVNAYAFQHFSILNSGLSNMFFAGVQRHGYLTPVDLWTSLREHVEAHSAERAFYWAYWGDVDTFSHKFGPDHPRIQAEFAGFVSDLEQNFLLPLSPAARQNTLFVLAADHGQVHTEKDPHYDLRNHPGLLRRLHMQPTGENRLAFLYVRPGQIEAVREYIERTWPGQFVVLESAYAAEQGLMGGGPHSPHLPDRMGDLTVIARGPAYWWWGAKENPLLGRHGGLMEQEMVVPFLAAGL